MTNDQDGSQSQHDPRTPGTPGTPGTPAVPPSPHVDDDRPLRRQWHEDQPAGLSQPLDVETIKAMTDYTDAQTRAQQARTHDHQVREHNRLATGAAAVWIVTVLAWLGFAVTGNDTTAVSAVAISVTSVASGVFGGNKDKGKDGGE